MSATTKMLSGFRPLAGFWFLKADRLIGCEYGEEVSVPLRGSGS